MNRICQIGTVCLVALGLACKGSTRTPVEQSANSALDSNSPPTEITNAIGMQLVLVPAGEFMMGSPSTGPGSTMMGSPGTGSAAAELQHFVRITKPFYLGKYEVTQGQWERVMGTKPSCFRPGGERGGIPTTQDTSRFPVDRISWDGATTFCRRLSSLPEERSAGRVYGLPTESQWEYACRAGTTTPFHFGDELTGWKANCAAIPKGGTTKRWPILKRTTMVGSYSANAFGLHDMHGNVREWCADWFSRQYYTTSPVDDPPGPQDDRKFVLGGGRSVRGGSHQSRADDCRSAHRFGETPASFDPGSGFRVTLVQGPVADAPEQDGPPRQAVASGDTEPPLAESTVDLGDGVTMEFVLLPAGEFMMGDNQGHGSEKPVHKVKITQPFYLGKYEVTAVVK